MPHTHLRYKSVEVVEVERKGGLGKWWNAPAFSLGLHSRQEMGTLPSHLKPVAGGPRTTGRIWPMWLEFEEYVGLVFAPHPRGAQVRRGWAEEKGRRGELSWDSQRCGICWATKYMSIFHGGVDHAEETADWRLYVERPTCSHPSEESRGRGAGT